MAIITNLTQYLVPIVDRNGAVTQVAPGTPATIANALLDYSLLQTKIADGQISVSGYVDGSSPDTVAQNFASFAPSATSFTGATTLATGMGTATTANTNYIAVVANPARRFLSITNTHATAVLVINPLGLAYDAALKGIPLAVGATHTWSTAVPNTAVNVASSTAAATYFVVEG